MAAKRSRSIKFNPNVKVVLIPARQDYETSNLAGSLWWFDHEYQDFKQDAVIEIRDVMSRYLLTPKDAALRLYQTIEIYEGLTGLKLNQLQAKEYLDIHNGNNTTQNKGLLLETNHPPPIPPQYLESEYKEHKQSDFPEVTNNYDAVNNNSYGITA